MPCITDDGFQQLLLLLCWAMEFLDAMVYGIRMDLRDLLGQILFPGSIPGVVYYDIDRVMFFHYVSVLSK